MGAAFLAAVVAALVVVAGIALAVSQHRARRDILARFAQRATYPVQVTSKTIGTSIAALSQSFGHVLASTGGRVTPQVFESAVATITPGEPYSIAYASDGRLLAATPPGAARVETPLSAQTVARAASGSGFITDIGGKTPGCPCADYLVPVHVGGGTVVVIRSPNSAVALQGYLADILAAAPTVPGGSALVLDGSGRVLASSNLHLQLGGAAAPALVRAARRGGEGALHTAAGPSHYTAAAVPFSDWDVIVTAPDSQLLRGASGFSITGPWLLLGALVAAAIAASLLWLRLQRAAERLADGEVRYRRLVEQLPGIVYIAEFGEHGAWSYVSAEIEAILGFTAAEWLADPTLWSERLHPDDRERALTEESSSLDGTPLYSTYRLRAKDGRVVWVRDEATVLTQSGRKLMQGVMYDVTELKSEEFTARAFASALQASVNERTAELEESRRETLSRLAMAAEYRDDATHEHTERVGQTAALIARALGADPDIVDMLAQAAPLHDLGKLAISDSILLKPGRLAPEEFAIIAGHPQAGARILGGSGWGVLQMAETIALSHHERWDGTGYPRGLRAEEIPLVSRIVAIADVFDALTHDRPYKAAWDLEDALAEILAQAGRHFDPRVVDAFMTLDHAALVRPAPPVAVQARSPGAADARASRPGDAAIV
jgi:PAS domain S-box-containing protein